jgi:hypothetical protein
MARLRQRQRRVAASNRMVGCTDASRGVVPQAVADDADIDFWDVAHVAGLDGMLGEPGEVTRSRALATS